MATTKGSSNLSDTDANPPEEQITIMVSPLAREFHAPRHLLTQHSDYFRKALQPNRFKEGADRTITINDIKCWVFDAFLTWLHRKTLEPIYSWFAKYDSKWNKSWNIVQLYAFADRFQVPGFKTYLVTLAIQGFNDGGTPSLSTIEYAFEHLPERSPFLRLLVDAFCGSYSPDLGDENEMAMLERLPHEFLLRVLKRYAQTSVKGWLFKTVDYEEP